MVHFSEEHIFKIENRYRKGVGVVLLPGLSWPSQACKVAPQRLGKLQWSQLTDLGKNQSKYGQISSDHVCQRRTTQSFRIWSAGAFLVFENPNSIWRSREWGPWRLAIWPNTAYAAAQQRCFIPTPLRPASSQSDLEQSAASLLLLQLLLISWRNLEQLIFYY